MVIGPSNPPPARTDIRQSFVSRYLDPGERLGEVMFGLIMVLTFTLGAGLIVKEGQEATTQMLVGILGCNTAWGLIDGGMYVMNRLFERSRRSRLLESIRKAPDEEAALAVVGRELDDGLEPLTSPEDRTRLYRAILGQLRHVAPRPSRLKKEDVYGAIASFWLVFLSTIPAVLPFLVFTDRFVALRVSNLLLLALLFLVGHRYARATHNNPWIFGSILVLTGLTMVAIAMSLGG